MEDNINERIEIILKTLGIGHIEFSKKTGQLYQTTLNVIVNKRNKPSYAFLHILLKTFPQVSPDYLMLGAPPVYRTDVELEKGVDPFDLSYIPIKDRGRIKDFLEQHRIPIISNKNKNNYIKLLTSGQEIKGMDNFYEYLDYAVLPNTNAKSVDITGFEIEGTTTEPLFFTSDHVFGVELERQHWNFIRDGDIYIIVSPKGVFIERIESMDMIDEPIVCVPENPDYKSYKIEKKDVLKIFKYVCHLSCRGAKNTYISMINKLEMEIFEQKEMIKFLMDKNK